MILVLCLPALVVFVWGVHHLIGRFLKRNGETQ